MKMLASFIMRGHSQALLVIVGFAVLSLVLPPLSILSGAAVALVTLRLGVRLGAVLVAGATVLVAALAWFSLGSGIPALMFLAALWLPLWIMASVLHASRSLAMASVVAGLLGLAGVLVAHLAMGDMSAWWRQILLTIFEPAMEAGGPLADREMVTGILEGIARFMTGLMAAGMVLNALICLYLARGWQAALYNPGGFRNEFYELRLGRWMGLIALAVMGLYLAPLGDVSLAAGDMMIVALSLYLLQGMALAHAIVAMRKLHIAWLVGLYVVVFFALPQLMAVVAIIGLADTWFDFRRRLAGPTGQQQ